MAKGEAKRKPRINWAAYNERIKWLAKKNRRPVTPRDIVKDAQENKSAPYHDYFTWDVKKAAFKRWLDEARNLLGRIKVLYEDDAGNAVSVREYVRVVVDRPDTHKAVGAYVPRSKVISTRYMKDQCVEKAIAEQQAWKNRWRTFPEMEAGFHYVDRLILQLQGAKGKKFKKAR